MDAQLSTPQITETERKHLRRAVDLAHEAIDAGDGPYGSVLVDAAGTVRYAERNREQSLDGTRHPEFEIARWAGANLTPEERRTSVVYTSTEHCPMCSSAHAIVGLGKIVYASSGAQNAQWREEWGFELQVIRVLPINEIAPGIEVHGPIPEFTAELRGLQARMLGVTLEE